MDFLIIMYTLEIETRRILFLDRGFRVLTYANEAICNKEEVEFKKALQRDPGEEFLCGICLVSLIEMQYVKKPVPGSPGQITENHMVMLEELDMENFYTDTSYIRTALGMLEVSCGQLPPFIRPPTIDLCVGTGEAPGTGGLSKMIDCAHLYHASCILHMLRGVLPNDITKLRCPYCHAGLCRNVLLLFYIAETGQRSCSRWLDGVWDWAERGLVESGLGNMKKHRWGVEKELREMEMQSKVSLCRGVCLMVAKGFVLSDARYSFGSDLIDLEG